MEKRQNVKEKLTELLSKYFDIGDSYCYNLTRTKNAFACGTMGLDDFEEFDEETVSDIADRLIANGVTVQEWIPVTERLPEFDTDVLVFNGDYIFVSKYFRSYFGSCDKVGHLVWRKNSYAKNPTHWMPLPQPPKGE